MAVNKKIIADPKDIAWEPVSIKLFGDPKGEFLSELINRRNYWINRPEAEAKEYAAAYERLIAAFTMPKSES